MNPADVRILSRSESWECVRIIRHHNAGIECANTTLVQASHVGNRMFRWRRVVPPDWRSRGDRNGFWDEIRRAAVYDDRRIRRRSGCRPCRQYRRRYQSTNDVQFRDHGQYRTLSTISESSNTRRIHCAYRIIIIPRGGGTVQVGFEPEVSEEQARYTAVSGLLREVRWPVRIVVSLFRC